MESRVNEEPLYHLASVVASWAIPSGISTITFLMGEEAKGVVVFVSAQTELLPEVLTAITVVTPSIIFAVRA
jgi:hypothetical protein